LHDAKNYTSNKQVQHMDTIDAALTTLIAQAVESGIRRALDGQPNPTQPDLLSVKAVAVRLGLSSREIYNMLATGELACVHHGKRKLVDAAGLREWITRHREAA
jgi:excisionase family DNA binding protein